ncbi:MAG TPA: TSUP family transporter [Methyloceanibacter sp.]|nr:TSUP family transporter [Methyloceanibacter sp.]
MKPRHETVRGVAALGAVGGFVDAVGGGGWGPVVTTTLVGAGGQPRYVIGTVNTAEFLVTAAVSATFIAALLTGHWDDAGDLTENATAMAGLIVGGLLAAPLAGYVVKRISPRMLGIGVGALVLILVAYQTVRLIG